jgi:cytidyltransferase-like protein
MEYLPKNFNKPLHRVAIFGGSFDPPTLGHQNVIAQLVSLSEPKIDEIVLIPSASHAFGKKLSSLSERIAMLELFIDDIVALHPNLKTKIHILNIEPGLVGLHATGYVYSYDVLEAVEKIYQSALVNQGLSSLTEIQLCFVIGPDLANPQIFNRFYRAEEIKKRWSIILVSQLYNVRSTGVREEIAKNGLIDLNHLNMSLSPRVKADIICHKRYVSSPLPVLKSGIKIKLDLVIFSIQYNDLFILLNQNSMNQLPYALIDPLVDKQLEEALNRRMMSQLGELPKYYEQVITQGGQKNNSDTEAAAEWCLSITYFCLTNRNKLNNFNLSKSDITNTDIDTDTDNIWIKVSDFMAESLSIEQKNSVLLCVERLKNKASYTSIPCYLATEPFTLSELQKIYEIVLGYKLEKKSFRRRFIESGLLEDTGNARKANHRPAQLYQLSNKAHAPYYFTRIIEGSRSN